MHSVICLVFGLERAYGVEVGVYYYPWYGSDFHYGSGYLREHLVPPQSPVLGKYNDQQASVISQHIEWSKQANVNLWAASWWGPGGREDTTLLQHILPSSDLGNLQIAIHYETEGRTNKYDTLDNVQSDVEYIAKNYFGHSNYFTINGKPVIFVYQAGLLFLYGLLDKMVDLMRTAAQNEGYQDIYIVGDGAWRYPSLLFVPGLAYVDALTNYDVYGSLHASGYAGQDAVDQYYAYQERWRNHAHLVGTDFIPAATPGFNDKGVRAGNTPLSRQLTESSEFGSLFRAMLQQAVQLVDDSTGGLLMITSFNEWHEDTQIEPVNLTDATKIDDSATGTDYTNGLAYEGYGEAYLNILNEETASR